MKIELLPVERWPELRRAFTECRSEDPLPLPKPEHSIILGAFEGDRIIGVAGAERTWQVSPFWIDKEHRGNGLAVHLATEIEKQNVEGFDELLVTTNPHIESLVYRMGFLPVPGVIWRRSK